jgi:hypothetical protein
VADHLPDNLSDEQLQALSSEGHSVAWDLMSVWSLPADPQDNKRAKMFEAVAHLAQTNLRSMDELLKAE